MHVVCLLISSSADGFARLALTTNDINVCTHTVVVHANNNLCVLFRVLI